MSDTCELKGCNQIGSHRHEEHLPEPAILDNILEHIGNTPLVRINKIAKSEGLQCELCTSDSCMSLQVPETASPCWISFYSNC
ncbi:hypothetical protein EDD21DRAFT_419604 [Dissophora ornata]|nr:hypothetical protein EDD21DRAFT_419604 [Dissophora ornata]